MASLIFLLLPRKAAPESILPSRKLLGVDDSAVSDQGLRPYLLLRRENFPASAILDWVGVLDQQTYALEWDEEFRHYKVKDAHGQDFFLPKAEDTSTTLRQYVFPINPSSLHIRMGKEKQQERVIGGLSVFQYTGNNQPQISIQGAFPIVVQPGGGAVQRIEETYYYQAFLEFREWYERAEPLLTTHFLQLLYKEEAYMCRYLSFEYSEDADSHGLLHYGVELSVDAISSRALLQDPYLKRQYAPSLALG